MQNGKIRNYLEYIFVRSVLNGLAALPRGMRLRTGETLGLLACSLAGKLNRTARRNLQLALPDLSEQKQDAIIKGVFRNFGRLLAEFSYFPKFTPENIGKAVVYSGLENYLAAMKHGKGVLFLTAHIGAWELSSFSHA